MRIYPVDRRRKRPLKIVKGNEEDKVRFCFHGNTNRLRKKTEVYFNSFIYLLFYNLKTEFEF